MHFVRAYSDTGAVTLNADASPAQRHPWLASSQQLRFPLKAHGAVLEGPLERTISRAALRGASATLLFIVFGY